MINLDIDTNTLKGKFLNSKNLVYCGYDKDGNLVKIGSDIKDGYDFASQGLKSTEERFEGRCDNGRGAFLHKSTITCEEVKFMTFDEFFEKVAEHDAEVAEEYERNGF